MKNSFVLFYSPKPRIQVRISIYRIGQLFVGNIFKIITCKANTYVVVNLPREVRELLVVQCIYSYLT